MTRIFTDGAEVGDVLFFDSPGGVSAVTAQKRSGSYSYTTGSNSPASKTIANLAEFYVRFGVRLTNTNTSKLFVWRNGTTELGSLRVNGATAKLELYTDTGTLVDTGDTTLVADTWYLFEVYVKINDSGELTVRVDGVTDATFTGDTKPGADTYATNIYWSHAFQAWFDDLALNDTNGGSDNSWCGDGRVIYLVPNAAGDQTEWSPSATGSANYTCVDEIPTSSSDFVESATPGQRDLYNLATTGFTNETILRIWAEGRGADTLASGTVVSFPIKSLGGVFDDASGTSLLTTYTKQLLGPAHTTNPMTSGTWSIDQLNNLQVGPENVS